MKNSTSKETYFLLFLCLLGCFLRVVWNSDMEWKSDEIQMHALALQAAQKGEWPTLGIMSSVGIPNPGFSVWLFVLVAKFTSDPLIMNQMVEALNVATVLAFLIFCFLEIPEEKRRPWLWGIALYSVSALPILLSRKIWAQCWTPPFFFLFFLGHWKRKTLWGPFLWGVAGSLLAQIHMGGFFIVLGVFLVTTWHDYKAKTLQPSRLASWFIGSALASLLFLPWLNYVLHHPAESNPRDFFSFRFYTLWFATAWGLNLKYSLGSEFFGEFVKLPRMGNFPTYIIGLLHLYLLSEMIRTLLKKTPWIKIEQPEFHLLFNALFWGVGLTFTFLGVRVFTHYQIPFFIIMSTAIAMKLMRSRTRLAIVVACQLALSLSYLSYIHIHGGAPLGDYGTSYRLQKK